MDIFQPVKKEIDGVEFHIYPFKAIEALKLKTTFLKKLAPAFGQLIGDADLKENINIENIQLEGKALSGALQTLFEGLGENELIELITRFVRNTHCIYTNVEGKQQTGELKDENVFNIVFDRKLTLVYKLVFEIIKVNYPDFFVLLGGIGNRIQTFIER